jgi:hypothetical protein
LIAGVDRKSDEAKARLTDGEVVDVELEFGGQGCCFDRRHSSSRMTSTAIARASFRVP